MKGTSFKWSKKKLPPFLVGVPQQVAELDSGYQFVLALFHLVKFLEENPEGCTKELFKNKSEFASAHFNYMATDAFVIQKDLLFLCEKLLDIDRIKKESDSRSKSPPVNNTKSADDDDITDNGTRVDVGKDDDDDDDDDEYSDDNSDNDCIKLDDGRVKCCAGKHCKMPVKYIHPKDAPHKCRVTGKVFHGYLCLDQKVQAMSGMRCLKCAGQCQNRRRCKINRSRTTGAKGNGAKTSNGKNMGGSVSTPMHSSRVSTRSNKTKESSAASRESSFPVSLEVKKLADFNKFPKKIGSKGDGNAGKVVVDSNVVSTKGITLPCKQKDNSPVPVSSRTQEGENSKPVSS